MHDFSLFLMMFLRDWEIKFSFFLHISQWTVEWIILNMLLVLFWILTPHQIIFYYGYGAVNLANRSSGHLRLYLREVTPLEIEFFTESAKNFANLWANLEKHNTKIWNCISWPIYHFMKTKTEYFSYADILPNISFCGSNPGEFGTTQGE